MGIYIILLALSLVFILIKGKIDKIIILLFLALIVIVPTFRNLNIGADTNAYFSYFMNPQLGWGLVKTETEIGYQTFSSFIRLIYNNGYFFMCIASVVSFIGPILLISKFSKNKQISIFILLTFGSGMSMYFLFFSMQRQVIAMSMFLIALYFYTYNRSRINWKVILFTSLAILFHITAILIIIPFIVSFIRYFNKYIYISIIIVSSILGAVIEQYLSYLIPYLEIIGKSQYILNMAEKSYSYGVTLPLTVIVSVMIYFDKSNIFRTIFGKTLILGVITNNLFYSVPESPRLVLYYLIVGIIVFPYFIQFKKNDKLVRTVILYSLLLFYSRMYLLNVTTITVGNPVVPYSTWVLVS